MTNDLNDFIGKTKPMNKKVTGVSNNKASITAKGSGNFKIEDDQGVTCNIYVHHLYYCDSVPYKVLSPQNLDSTWRARRIGTFSEATDGVGTLLMWKNKSGEYTKRVVHTGRSGIPLCHTAPSYKKYKEFLVQEKKYQEDDKKLTCLFLGMDPVLEQPEVNKLEFEIKKKDVQILNSRTKPVDDPTTVK
jgi:hypothetical protein